MKQQHAIKQNFFYQPPLLTKMKKQVRFRERVLVYPCSDESSSYRILDNNNSNNNNKDERITETTRRRMQTNVCCETNNVVVKEDVMCKTVSSNEQRHYYRRCLSAPEQLQKQQIHKHDDDPRGLFAVSPLLLDRSDAFLSPSASPSSSSVSQKQIGKLSLTLSSNTTTATADIAATAASTPPVKLSEGLRQPLLVELLERKENNSINNNVTHFPVHKKSAESINTTTVPIIHVAENNDDPCRIRPLVGHTSSQHHPHPHDRRRRPNDTPPVMPVRKPFSTSKSKSTTGMALFESTVLQSKIKNKRKR